MALACTQWKAWSDLGTYLSILAFFRIFIVGLAILEYSVDMPIIVNDILIFVDLEGHSQILEGPVDSRHFKVAQKAH